MQVYTYSEARQKLAMVLEKAEATGKVLIRRKDRRTFSLVPERSALSPLDVSTIKARITSQEIVVSIREGRERQNLSLHFDQEPGAPVALVDGERLTGIIENLEFGIIPVKTFVVKKNFMSRFMPNE